MDDDLIAVAVFRCINFFGEDPGRGVLEAALYKW